ncbi:MAG: TolC family protein [Dechloromonas sp.]|nr:TolC family protein [Dechloromonas sp.]
MRILIALLSLWPLLAQAINLSDPWPLDSQLAVQAPCVSTLPAEPLTAVAAVDLALCRQPQTREVWALARSQAAQWALAEAAWLPRLDGKVQATRSEGQTQSVNSQTAALSLSWLLLDGGQRTAGRDYAGALLEAALGSRDATVQTVFLAAVQSFHAAQAAQAAVQAAGEAERAAQASYAAAEARYQIGAGTPADRLQAKTAWSQAILNRQRSIGEASNARGALAYALGFPASTPLVLADRPVLADVPAMHQNVDRLIERALVQRPDLRAAEAQLRAAQASVAVAQAAGRPTVTLAAGPSWQRLAGQESQSSTLGLTLNVPLFTAYDTTYRVQQAVAQVDVRGAQRDRLHHQVALEVWRAYQNWQTAGHSLRMTADLMASAEQSALVALGRYQAGVGSVLELLSAQSALASARLQRIQAELDWQVSRATLAQAMGILDGAQWPAALEEKK